MRAFVTGAAGFIGSNLVDRLLANGASVVGWDNFSTGIERFLEGASTHPAFRLERGDNLDLPGLRGAMAGCDTVFHLAANADVRFGLDHPDRDLQQNTIATFHVLEAMRANGIRKIAFSSTGSVYGESTVIPTPEDAPFPVQTSLYGASKLACEGLIAAYADGYAFEPCIFRFVSILGERYTHGHIFDFVKQLRAHPERLDVLGNGTQRKSYLAVSDCVSAILHSMAPQAESGASRVQIYNLGADHFCSVKESIAWICARLNLAPRLCFGESERGWVGDNPFIFLDTARIRSLGWKPRFTIREGVGRTVDFLQANPWVFESR